MEQTYPRRIELLAPARNAQCAIEAIRSGADAVYIGAPRFGARAAAGNTVADIKEIVTYAHVYGVRIYVALNTILYDEELDEARSLVWELYEAGADALIVQDMALLQMDLPPIALHASTQMNNVSPEAVRFLYEEGFRQVVLARELSLQEISAIHKAVPVPLEVFVHGALCVSYSGQCYASQQCFGRSANRGECAQFCRLAFNLEDFDGNVVVEKKHLLSLKDMNRSDSLESLLDAGVSSLKIEGRLKDASYVKNVTAYYRQALDKIFAVNKKYVRASSGKCLVEFEPKLEKSFNRGFTDYFLHERKPGIHSFDTPKSLGENVGVVKEIRGRSFTVAGLASFSNGDGLCYISSDGSLKGFRVNKVENNRLFPMELPADLKPKMQLYRNQDIAFERELSKSSPDRKIEVDISFCDTPNGFSFSLTDEDSHSVSKEYVCDKQLARTEQKKNIEAQLSKLGNTPFSLRSVSVELSSDFFLPSSQLALWRREMVEALLKKRVDAYVFDRSERKKHVDDYKPFVGQKLTYLSNVSNVQAAGFYMERGAASVAPALEVAQDTAEIIMYCKHCIRFSLGICPTRQNSGTRLREPLFLALPDGRRFRLAFDCRRCIMKVYAPE